MVVSKKYGHEYCLKTINRASISTNHLNLQLSLKRRFIIYFGYFNTLNSLLLLVRNITSAGLGSQYGDIGYAT